MTRHKTTKRFVVMIAVEAKDAADAWKKATSRTPSSGRCFVCGKPWSASPHDLGERLLIWLCVDCRDAHPAPRIRRPHVIAGTEDHPGEEEMSHE